MLNKVIIGRDKWEIEKFGDKGTGFIGKCYVGEKGEARLTVPVYLDLARPHVIGIFGKRGTGKSYTLGTLVEEIINLPEEIKENIAVVVIDTMGIFWSMKNPNERDFKALMKWNLHPRAMPVEVLVPYGLENKYREDEIPYDGLFSFTCSDLMPEDWMFAFGIDEMSEHGTYLERVVSALKERSMHYEISDIIEQIKNYDMPEYIKNYLINKFYLAKSWGVFTLKGTEMKDLVQPGKVVILDVSLLGSFSLGWNVRTLIVGLLARKILFERMKARRKEEMESLRGFERSFMPITWMLIDEAHQFLPAEGKTAATDPLLQWVKIGREPGVSLVLATQQPNKLHEAAISQMDVVISHRLTARNDIEALKNIMQTYLRHDLGYYLDSLPRVKGAAIILDDNSERIYAVQMRPRISWHAGGSPTAIKE